MKPTKSIDPLGLGPFKEGDKAECFCGTHIELVFAEVLALKIKWWRGEDGSSHCYYEDSQKYIPVEGAWHQPMEPL